MCDVLGIMGTTHEWFRSYLAGRSQKLKIGRSLSLADFLLYCLLGPLLFLIYNLPLAVLLRKHGLNIHDYADDTQIYLNVSPLDKATIISSAAQVEACLEDIYKWMSQNMRKLNSDKTELLIL